MRAISMLDRRVRVILLPLLVAVVLLSWQAFRKPLGKVVLDEFYYLTITRDLLLHGVFTNGTYKRGPFGRTEGPAAFGDEDPRWARPGRFFAPAYPLLVHAVARLDPRLDASIRCHVRHAQTPAADACPRSFGTLVALQVVLWGLVALAVFHIGLRVSRSETVAWLAMLIALATGEPGYFARTYLSENLTVPAFVLFMLFALRAADTQKLADYAVAGGLLGIAALARPAYAYLLYALAPLLLAASVVRWKSLPSPLPRHVLAFILAAFLVLSPWMIRNLMVFGDVSLSKGYAEVILPQRLAYNQMSWGEWAVAWLYWLPDFGDNLAKRLFRPELWERLSWNHPQSFYLQGGLGDFVQRIVAQTSSDAEVMPLLLKTYLLGDLFKHLVVTLPLTMRGLGVGGYLSVAGGVLAWPAMRSLHRDGRLVVFLAAALPPLLMAGLHGFVSVNIQRYNLPMIAVYAVIVAIVVDRQLADFRCKRSIR